MNNDSLITGANKPQNAKPNLPVEGTIGNANISGLPNPNVGGLPNPNREQANFVYRPIGTYKSNDSFTIPGLGEFPSLSMDTLNALGFVQNPMSNISRNKDTAVNDNGIDSRPVDEIMKAGEAQLGLGKNSKDVADDSEYRNLNRFLTDYGKGGGVKLNNINPDDYRKYMGEVYADQDIDNLRAIGQSGLEQARYGIARFLGTTLTAATESFIHMAMLPTLVGDNKLVDVYDNAATRSLDRFNDYLREAMPIYQTNAQRDSDAFSWTNLSSGSFWWDRALNGAAFIAGTLINAWLTAGMLNGLSATVAGMASKAKFAKTIGDAAIALSRAEGSAEGIAEIAATLADGNRLMRIAKSAGDMAKGTGEFMFKNAASYIAASAEGGVEARDMKSQLLPILQEQVAKGEITQEQADRDLEKAMNTVYALNVGVVGLSTHMQFGGMFARAGRKAANVAEVGLIRSVDEQGKRTLGKLAGESLITKLGVNETSRLAKFINLYKYANPFVESAITESAEEGSQFIIAGAAKDYYSSRKGRDYAESLLKATEETFGTKEGQESMFIGALMGALGTGFRYKSFLNQLAHNQQVADVSNGLINGSDSRIRKAMVHFGKIELNNQTALNVELHNSKDQESLDILDKHFMADIASFAHSSGTVDVIKEYMDDYNNLPKERFDAEFPTMAGLNEEGRKKVIARMVNEFDDLVKLKDKVEENYSELDENTREHLFHVTAFHNDTKKLYENQIVNLRERFGVDVVKINSEVVKEYRKEREDHYNAQRAAAYNTYKNSLGENANGIAKEVFDNNYDKEHKTEAFKEYDAAVTSVRNIRRYDKASGEWIAVPVSETGNLSSYLLARTNAAIADSINNSAINTIKPSEADTKAAMETFDNYLRLQNSYQDTERLLKSIVEEDHSKLKTETIEKLVTADTEKNYGKGFNDVSKTMARAKKESADKAEAEFNAYSGKLNDRITELEQTLRNKSIARTDYIAYQKELHILKNYRKRLIEQHAAFKDKHGNAEIATEKSNQDVRFNDETEAISDESEKVDEKAKEVSKILKRIDNASQALNAAKDIRVDLEAALDKFNDDVTKRGVDVLLQTELNIIRDINDLKDAVKDSSAKDIDDRIRRIKEDSVNLLDTAKIVKSDFEKTINDKEAKDKVAPEDAVVFDSEVIAERYGIEGTVEERMNTLMTVFNRMVPADNPVNSEIKATIGSNPSARSMSLNEASYYLFGDGIRQRGLIQEYIAEKYGRENVNGIMNDTLSVMRVLDNIFMSKNGVPMHENMYRFMYGQYVSIRNANPLTAEEQLLYSFRNYNNLKIEIEDDSAVNGFMNRDYAIKSSDIVETKDVVEEHNYVYDYANGVVANRETVKGNQVLENLYNEDNVHPTAPVKFKVANVKVTVGGETISAVELASRIADGNLENISTLELADLPIDIFDGKGNKIGHLKTHTDVKRAADNFWLPNTNKEVDGEIVNAERHELNRTIENRLAILFALKQQGDIAGEVGSHIDRVGTGFAKKEVENFYVRARIQVPGTKILIAKTDKFNFTRPELYENGARAFRGVVHNTDSLEGLKSGIAYAAIPVGKNTTAENPIDRDQPVYMIMPLQSTKIQDINLQDLNSNEKGTYTGKNHGTIDNVENMTNVQVFNENTIGERMRMSMVKAIEMFVKIKTNTDLNDTERVINKVLGDASYNIDSHEGLSKYLSEFTHTYDKTPADVAKGAGVKVNIDNILINRIKDPSFSIVRVSPNMIEIGKVENKEAFVTTIFIKDGVVHFSQYSIKDVQGKKENVVNREYKDLNSKGFKDRIYEDIYEALNMAYAHVNVEKLNKGVEHVVPLVNLKVGEHYEAVVNGKRQVSRFKNNIDHNEPIDAKAINFKDYDDYAKAILKTDISTTFVGDKAVYSRNKAVHVNTTSIEDRVQSQEFEDFKRNFKEVSGKNTQRELRVVSNFNGTEIANYRYKANTKFANAFDTVYNNLVNYFDMSFAGNGVVTMKDKTNGQEFNIDLSGVEEDTNGHDLLTHVQRIISDSRNIGEVVNIDIVSTDAVTRTPVKRKELVVDAHEESTTKPVSDTTKQVDNNYIDPSLSVAQIKHINNFINDAAGKDEATIDGLISVYTSLLAGDNLADYEAQDILEKVLRNRTNLDASDNIGKNTLRSVAESGVKQEDSDVLTIAKKHGIVDNEGNFVTIHNQNRAVTLANKARKELADKGYDVTVLETSRNPVNVSFKVVITPSVDHTEIFGENYVAMLKAINENKGFIPFVSPIVVGSVTRNLANTIVDRLVKSNNEKGTVDTVVEEFKKSWTTRYNSIKSLYDSKLSDGTDETILEAFKRDVIMMESLINNVNTIKDMAIQGLISDNIIKFNAKKASIKVQSADTSLSTGDLSMEDSDLISDDDVDETDDSDYTDNSDEVEDTTGWSGESISTNHKKGASASIKKFLMGIKNLKFNKNGELVTVKDAVGNIDVLDYHTVYNTLLRQFSNRPQSIGSVLDTLRALEKENPIYHEILAKLEKECSDPKSSIPYEFVKLVNKTRVNMIYSRINNHKFGKQGGLLNQLASSNKGDIKNIVMEQWHAHFITNPHFTKVLGDNSIIVNNNAIEEHIKNYSFNSTAFSKLLALVNTSGSIKSINNAIDIYNKQLITDREKANKNKSGVTAYSIFDTYNKVETAADVAKLKGAMKANVKTFVKGYTNTVGLNITEESIDFAFNKHKKVGTKDSIIPLFISGNNSNFAASLFNITKFGVDDDLSVNKIEPKVRNSMKPILALEVKFNHGVDPDTFRDRTNKAIYSYTNYKHIDEVLAELHTNDNLFNEISSTAFGKDCYLLRDLADRIHTNASENRYDYSNDIRFTYADSLVVQGKHNKTETVKINEASEGDLELFKLMSFYNRGNREALFFYPTLSDGKSVMMLGMNRIDVTSLRNDDDTFSVSSATIKTAFEHIVRPEINRIFAGIRAGETGIKNFDKGSRHFILNNYLDSILEPYRKKGDQSILDNEEAITAKALAKFEEHVNKSINDKVESWTKLGLVTKGKVNFIDEHTLNERHYSKQAFRIAADFEINNMVFNMGVNQIFMGDTATYWAGSINKTIDNMSKRLAGHRGPGEIGNSANREDKVRVVTAADLETVSAAKEYLDSIKANTKGITATDGQELTSLYEDLSNRVNYNGISKALFDALYNDEDAVIYKAFEKMFKDGGNENYNYEDDIMEHLKNKDMDLYYEYVRMTNQPVKPMYFGTRTKTFNGENIRSAVYIKSSSFALRPTLTRNMAIDQLRKAMDYSTYEYLKAKRAIEASKDSVEVKKQKLEEAVEKRVDRYSFESSVKLGANTAYTNVTPEVVFGHKEGAYRDTYDLLNASSETLPRKGFRIQQDLPFDPEKEKIGVGTQERKLLFNGLLDVESLEDIRREYDALYNEVYKQGYETLLNEISKEVNGEIVPDYSKLSAIAIKEGLTRNYDDNDIAELRVNATGTGFEVPISFHRKDKAIESLMLSIVNNRVIKMKFPGRSFVLGTEAGFNLDAMNKDADKGSGIVYTSKFTGSLKPHGFVANKKIVGKNGKTYEIDDYLPIDELEYLVENDDYHYQPDQIIVPSFFKDSKGKVITLREGYDPRTGKGKFIEYKNGKLMLKEHMFDSELFKTFGFRIPTQGHSSMASMEVVGFSDYKVGELVIAPRDFVYRMGSDFDIDKLYMYRYAFGMKGGKFVKVIDGDEKVNKEADRLLKEARQQLKDVIGDSDLDTIFKTVNNYFKSRSSRFESNDFKERVKQNLETAIAHQYEYFKDVSLEQAKAYANSILNGNSDEIRRINSARYSELADENNVVKVFKQALTLTSLDLDSDFNNIIYNLTGSNKDVRHIIDSIKDRLDKLYKAKENASSEVSSKYGKMNKIIDIHHKVFSNPNKTVQKAIGTPLSYGFFNQEYNPDSTVSDLYNEYKKDNDSYYLGEFIEDLYGDNTESLSPLSSTYQSNFYHKGKMGKVGIAMFSSRSVVNAILQQAAHKGQPIQMGEMVDGKFNTSIHNFTMGGADFDGANFGNNKVINRDDMTIADVISWYQSTSVDNAKLNKLHKLNINDATLDVINFMNQAGFHEQVLWLINQPIIRDYAAMTNAKEGLAGKIDSKEKVSELLRNKYKANVLRQFNKVVNINAKRNSENSDKDGAEYNFRGNSEFTSYRDSVLNMANNIKDYSKFKDIIGDDSIKDLDADEIKFFGTQLAILEEFIHLNENQAAFFKKAASVLNTDSKGLGANVDELAEKRSKLLQVKGKIGKHFLNFDKIIGEVYNKVEYNALENKEGFVQIGDKYFKPDGIVGNAIVYSVAGFEQIFKDDFIQFTDAYDRAITKVADMFSAWDMNDYARKELGRKILDHYKKYAHAYGIASIGIDIEKEYNRLMVDDIYQIRDEKTGEIVDSIISKASIATIIKEIQKGRFATDPLIASLVANSGTNNVIADIRYNNIAGNSDTDSKVIASIYNFINNNPVIVEHLADTGKSYTGRELIRDLFIYSEITGGVQRFGELVKFIPHELKKQLGLVNAIQNVQKLKPIDDDNFLVQFVQHNPSYARYIKLSKDKQGRDRLGVFRAEALNKVETTDEEGNTIISVVPVAHVSGNKNTHIIIDPRVYGVNEKTGNGPFIKDGEVKAPIIIRTEFKDDKGVINTSLFKLMVTSESDNGKDGLTVTGDAEYTPFMYNGMFIFERVDELGEGERTEYDPSVTRIHSKLSAVNKGVRSKYHTVFDPNNTTIVDNDNAASAAFVDYSPAAVATFLNKIANSDTASVVTKTMARFHRQIGSLKDVTVKTQKQVISDGAGDTEFTRTVHTKALGNGNPMFFEYDYRNNKAVIVVNEDYYKGAGNNKAYVERDFIHELGHFVVDSDNNLIDPKDSTKGYVSRFRKQGEALIKDAIKHLRISENWKHDVSIDKVLETLKGIVNNDAKLVIPNGGTKDAFIKEYRKYYGLINFNEFYAEAASNDEFLIMLSQIPASAPVTRGKSDVLDVNNKFGDTIFGAFLNIFKEFFNNLINNVFKSFGDTFYLRSNSVAEVAIYDFVVGGAKYSDKVGALTSNFLNSLGVTKSNTEVDTETIKEFMGETNTVDGEENGEMNEFFQQEKGANKNKAVDDSLSDVGNVNDFFAVMGMYHNEERSINSMIDNANTDGSIDEEQIDKILHNLVDNNRLEFSCKL